MLNIQREFKLSTFINFKPIICATSINYNHNQIFMHNNLPTVRLFSLVLIKLHESISEMNNYNYSNIGVVFIETFINSCT